MTDSGAAAVPVEPKLMKKLAAFGEPKLALPCRWKDKPAAVVITDKYVAVAGAGLTGDVVQSRLTHATRAARDHPLLARVTFYGQPEDLVFDTAADADLFHETFVAAQPEAVSAADVIEAQLRGPVLVVTMNDVPGYRITRVCGDVFGVTVRARNTFSNFAANFRTVVGGEVAGYTKMLTEARHEARTRMIDEARRLGANAIVAMRFDCSEIGDIMNETVAYGTAVVAESTVASTVEERSPTN